MATYSPLPALNDPELVRRVSVLRRPDNRTNWFYLAREYLFLGSVIGLALAFYHLRSGWGLGWGWDLPVTAVAILFVGIGQHRLMMLGHDASHYALFRNRLLNELASDLLCMFPVLSTTHNYRLQHMPHHQHVNDPQRDPDLVFMRATGHHFSAPVSRARFLWECVVKKALWLPGLIRYMRVRARYAALGGALPGAEPGAVRSRLLVGVGLIYLLTLAGVLIGLTRWGEPWLAAAVPGAMLAGVLAFYALVPGRLYARTSIKPVISPRWAGCLRLTYLTVLFAGLAGMSHLTGRPWGLYYLALWVAPLLTTFPLLMILREELQHGDAGREGLSHTRVFDGGPLVRFAVFPLGMDYHLPHHLFPMVPHYNLRRVHALLQEVEGYRRHAPRIADVFLRT